MELWVLFVWTVLISTVAHGTELPENKSYTKVSSSPYNNDSFEPDGKGRTISQVQTRTYLDPHPKTPTNLGTHTYSSKAKNLPVENAFVGLVGRKQTVQSHHLPAHIPSLMFQTNSHITTLSHASHVDNAAGASPIVSQDVFPRGISVSPNKPFQFQGSNSIPPAPAKHLFNQISAVTNYVPAEIPVRSSIHSFAPALLDTSATSAQAVPTVEKNTAIHNDIETTTTTQYHSQDELGQYTFGYSGGPSSRHETSDVDGTVRGSYSYVDPYGELQTQHYVADDDGFRVVATNILSNLLRKKRSLVNSKLFTAPANTLHSTYPIFYSTPRLHVPAQTISQTSYLNEPTISNGGSIAYTSTPVGTLTKTINYKEPVYVTGYVPRGKALIYHKEPIAVSVTDLVPITKSPSHHTNNKPGYVPQKAKALAYHVNYGLYHNSDPNMVDYSKITLFRANR